MHTRRESVQQVRVVLQIAASLLLFMEEEDTFWMMCAIIEDLLPASYYSSTLIGIQVKGQVWLPVSCPLFAVR